MHTKELQTLKQRLQRIGIEITFSINYPWVYIYSINGQVVKEKHASDHGFVIGYCVVKNGKNFHFTGINTIFNLLKKYVKSE